MRPRGSAAVEALMLLALAVLLFRWLLESAPRLFAEYLIAQLISLLFIR
ncbi:MAG: hypothetical protein RLZZ290_1659 [Pseudomonadota bacterium]|jgi:hypothetical protein